MSDYRLAVVIINYNSTALLQDCVESLLGQLDKDADTIVVVDNASQETELALLRATVASWTGRMPVELIASKINGGFSYGNNLGVEKIRAQYYLLANADTVFRKDSISELLLAAKRHPEAGLISPRLEWLDGTAQISCFRFHRPLSELLHTAANRLLLKSLTKASIPLELEDKESFPEWTSFAAVLICADVFQEVGPLDEKFFMYFEDVDFCKRAQQAGYRIVNAPSARVVHLRGQSSGLKEKIAKRRRLPKYYYNSRQRYYQKHYGKPGFLLANLCWSLGYVFALMKILVLRRTNWIPEKQWKDIWCMGK